MSVEIPYFFCKHLKIELTCIQIELHVHININDSCFIALMKMYGLNTNLEEYQYLLRTISLYTNSSNSKCRLPVLVVHTIYMNG